MSRKTVLMRLAALLLGLLQALEASALSGTERDALAMLTLGPQPDKVKQCVVSALELNLGLGLMLLGKTRDEDVRKKLLEGIENEALRQRQEALAQDWQKNHSPPHAANARFRHCLEDSNVNFDLGAAGPSCFSVAGVAVRAEAHKSSKLPKQEAVSETQRAYNNALPSDFIKKTVEAVYDNDAQASEYVAHRRAFIACVMSQPATP